METAPLATDPDSAGTDAASSSVFRSDARRYANENGMYSANAVDSEPGSPTAWDGDGPSLVLKPKPADSSATVAQGDHDARDGQQAFPWAKCIRTMVFIALWYVLSTCLTIYNKLLVSKDDNLLDAGPFPAPLLMTAVQFMFQAMACAAILWLRGTLSALKRSREEFMKAVLPNGVATGLDIGLSNLSLVFITTSFYTMCKSSSPLFLLLFAFVFRLERLTWDLVGVVAVIFLGLLLLVFGEAKFNLFGFVSVMLAAFLSGLRWTLTQILLQGKPNGGESQVVGGHGARKHSPVAVVGSLTPIMSVTVFLCSFILEQPWSRLDGSPWFADGRTVVMTMGVILVGALIAVAMVVSEFRVIQETDALTLMVAGSFKELLTVAAGVVVFGDTFTAVNAAGIAILVAGVALFNIRKYRQMAAARAHRGYALATGGDSAEGERGEEGERVGEGEGGVGEASASGRSVGSVEPLWAGAMGTGGEDSGWEREEGSGEGAPCAKRGGDAEMEMSAVRHREREGGGKRDVEEGLNVGKRMSEVPLGDGVWEEG